jgi:hypothetical protein
MDDVTAPANADSNRVWEKFLAQRDLAHKILLDICVDSDSEIITQINVLAANGDEAADALELLRLEEAAHGNDVQSLSIDGAGYNGPVLRELAEPEGLNVDTYVPVRDASSSELFPADAFVEDAERGEVTCPGGQTSQNRFRDEQKQTTKYRFAAATCRCVSSITTPAGGASSWPTTACTARRRARPSPASSDQMAHLQRPLR